MQNGNNFHSTHDSAYADFGRGRFDIVSGSKMSRIVAHAGTSILDVGCGPGVYIRALREQGYYVDGVEGNVTMAKEAQKTGAQIYQNDLDVDALSFLPDNSYDTTICLDVLEHLQHPLNLLGDLVRVAKKNVIVSVPAKTPDDLSQAGLVYAAYIDPTHLRYYSPQELRSAMQDVGLQNIEILPTFGIKSINEYLFPKHIKPLMRLLNRIFAHLMVPEANWSVLLGIGYKNDML